MKNKQQLQFITHIILLLFTVCVLGVIIWVGWQITQQSDLGVLWGENGVVYYAKPSSPIISGDKILEIDGIPILESSFPYFNWQRGDNINLKITRANEPIELIIQYSDRAPIFIVALRMSVMVIVLAFWLAGTIMVLFLPKNKTVGRLFFFWCQFMALALALGNVTSFPWAAHLSIFFTLWVVPIAIHLHLLFPLQQPTVRLRLLIPISYGISSLSIFEVLTAANLYEFGPGLNSLYTIFFLSWVSIGLIVVIFLLAKAYIDSPNKLVKQQVGLVAAAGTLSLTPLLFFTILPNILLGKPFVPAELMFVFMIGIPLGYSYAIRRYQFLRLERYISRTTTNMLVLGVLGAIYFTFTAVMQDYLPFTVLASPLMTFILILILMGIHGPLKSGLNRAVDRLFYGGWYDYPTVIGEIADSIEDTTDVKVLAETFCFGIRKTMRVHWACLILPETSDNSLISWISGTPETPFDFDGLQFEDLANIESQLKKHFSPLYGRKLLELIGKAKLTNTEQNFLLPNLERLWVPLKGKDASLGILILGAKFGGDLFDEKDMEILDIVARQVSIAYQKTQLISELTQTVRENERYQKEIIRAREEERKRVARDLHDQVIQELVGLNYQVAKFSWNDSNGNDNGADLKITIGTLIQTTREVCTNLRPPALDLGLIPSIRSLVARYERKTTMNYSLIVEGDRSIEIPEEVSLCLYQCALESLSNIRKHSFAENVHLELFLEPGHVILTIEDDGEGFVVPERLGSLMQENHFGLMGMRERLELMNGSFQIISAPQQGTKFHAYIPLSMNS